MIASEIMLPPHAPEIYLDRTTLWNAVESCEKHPKAQLAYSFDIAMQNELTLEENMELARKFVQEQFVAKGMIADLAFHSPEKEDGGIPNPHFHVMTTMRPLNPDGTWGQKQRREYLLDEDGNRIRDKNGDYMFNAVHTTDWHEPETLEHWREQWAAAVNTKFEEKGLDVRIDHRSYVRQGLDLIPTVHEGANVRQMEAKGIRTEKGELNRWIKATNRLMQDVRKKIKALFVWMAEVKEELSKPQTPNLADLLIAYYNQRNAGAWSNKARTGNLKQFAEAVNYLTENKLLTLEDLQERLSSVSEEFEALSGSMKKKSARIKELQELIREGENYQRLKPVHTELNNIKFKKQREKFETSHDAELRLFYAARRILKEKLDGKPIALKAWKQEYAQLKTEYAELSPQHKPLREEVRTRIHNHSTPSERVFCRPAPLKNLAIHKVLSAFFRLAGQQNPSPIRHPLIMDTGSNKRHRVYTCALLAMITMIVYVFSVCWWYLSIISSILIFCRLFCKSSRTF